MSATPSEVARHVGAVLPVDFRPHVEYASIDTIRNFAIACGDDNPLYCDDWYGRASVRAAVIAPPLFPIATGTPHGEPSPDAAAALAAIAGPPIEVVADEWRLPRAIVPGTRLERVDTLARVDESAGPRALIVTIRSTYSQDGVIFAEHDRTRRHGGDAAEPVPGARRSRYVYSDDELAAIDEMYASQHRQGARTRHVEDVAVGDRLGPLVKGPLTVTDLVSYRGGVGPGPLGAAPLRLGYLNRARRPHLYARDASRAWDTTERRHFDEAHAANLGYPTAYDYSHTRLVWASHLLTDWMGDGGWLDTITFAAPEHNFIGDTHWMTATIEAVEPRRDDGIVRVRFEGTNQLGVVTCSGTASLLLPRRPRLVAGGD